MQHTLNGQHKTVVYLIPPVKPIEKTSAHLARKILHSPLNPPWIVLRLERQNQSQVLLVNGIHIRLTGLGHVKDVITSLSLEKQFTHKGLWFGLVKDLHA